MKCSHCGTVEGFHTKGWTKFFSVKISTFWGQKNVFYDSVRLQAIFFYKIRSGQFVGQNSGYIALITSREIYIYISKMVCDSDLKSLSAVGVIFGDILMMNQNSTQRQRVEGLLFFRLEAALPTVVRLGTPRWQPHHQTRKDSADFTGCS